MNATWHDTIQEVILREEAHEEAERELQEDEVALIWAQMVKGN